ncbi:amidase family protein [Candidatus Saccharibacteria bacterium]|nr:amidase family protein [Candidatus Saccharibacteria bacterium]
MSQPPKNAKNKNVNHLIGVSFAIDGRILALGRESAATGKIMENFVSPVQATAVDRLLADGAVLVDANIKSLRGAHHTVIARSETTKQSSNKPGSPRYARDDTLVDSVVHGATKFALGVDTGGSVLQSAASGGVIGYKPTYGMISRYGVATMTSSMDTIGVIASSIADIESACQIMAGPDDRDSTLLNKEDFNFDNVVKNTTSKIGVIREFVGGEGKTANQLRKKLTEVKCSVSEISLNMAKYAQSIYWTLMPAEVSSNFMQYDGIRYGKRADAKTLSEIYSRSRAEIFSDEMKQYILTGFYVLSSENFEKYYMQAMKARTMLISELDKLFDRYDCLVCSADSTEASMMASLAGLPAMILPNGIQIIGPMKSDTKLLNFARGIEQ